jgi:hypothetical protein
VACTCHTSINNNIARHEPKERAHPWLVAVPLSRRFESIQHRDRCWLIRHRCGRPRRFEHLLHVQPPQLRLRLCQSSQLSWLPTQTRPSPRDLMSTTRRTVYVQVMATPSSDPQDATVTSLAESREGRVCASGHAHVPQTHTRPVCPALDNAIRLTLSSDSSDSPFHFLIFKNSSLWRRASLPTIAGAWCSGAVVSLAVAFSHVPSR